MIRKRIVVSGIREISLSAENIETIMKFISDPSVHLLVAYDHRFQGLTLSLTIPAMPVKSICYFIKSADCTEITSDSFLSDVQYGIIKGGHIESLLRMMMGVYAPIFFENRSWPDSIKNDFSAQLHRFLASLTDTRYKLEGKTVLYIPTEGTNVPAEEAAKNKELVQRLETSIIHWARQIKEVLSSQDAFEMAENSGPLEEIDFWKNRCADLSGITTQLDKPGVKRITQILELAKSSYVAPFLRLAGQIKEGSRQAESNLKFLSVLKDPCHELADAKPKDIPKLLPKILNLIRMIWVNSDFFNSREKLTGILRKMSNEIIRRCCAEIDLDKIFEGYVVSGKQTLHECIECCEHWKAIYDRISKLHHKYSNHGWLLDKSSIFAQVDAFIQRCKDMLEVCEAQFHFARQMDGNKLEMPQFAGQKGNEIIQSLMEIESQFEKYLFFLQSQKKNILDVKAASWHDSYNRFRAGMKDLEVMMQNTICAAFDSVRTVVGAVEVLDVFMHLSSREAIRRTIDKKTVETFNLFNEELNAVKKELSSKKYALTPSHTKFSGSAHWARLLKNRVTRSMNALDQAHFLPQIGTGEEVRLQYKSLIAALDEYIRKTYYEWTHKAEKENNISEGKSSEPNKLLEIPLMCRSHERPPMLDLNFNRQLVKMFQELYYWERLLFEVPHFAVEIYAKKDDLRILRENMLLVVREYNRIIAALSIEERGLFKERIKFLDKRLHPGLTKLFWTAKGTIEFFITECRNHCNTVQEIVDSYKIANDNISVICVKISELLLVKIDHKVVYENLQFDEDQAKHREHTSKKLKEMHESIVATLNLSFEVYKNDGPDVQQHWYRYTEKMDKMLEEAFRLNVKWSLQELSKSINGDGKSAPNPLFKVKVILEGERVEFSPTLQQLATIVGDIGKYHLIKAIADIKRLPDLLTSKKSTKDLSISETVACDDEIKKIQMVISSGMQSNALNLQSYLSTWDAYREIWEIQKDAFIRRYQKLNPQNSSFDADIARYNEVANNVQTQETILNIQFVLLDCSPLKYAILSHCQEWQNKFTTLLSEIAVATLKNLTEYLKSNAIKVAIPPQTLDELSDSLALWDKLNADLPATEEKFPPLYEQFVILEKYEVPISKEVTTMLNELPQEWENFQAALVDAENMLKKNKERFKAGLLQQAEDFKKQAGELFKDFETNGPFTSHIDTDTALATIQAVRLQMETLKEQEMTIRRGLSIFKIDQPLNRDLTLLEKDLENLKSVWELTKEWENYWDSWKSGNFAELETSEMENVSISLFKQLAKFSRSLKDKNWEIVEASKTKVDQFKRTMPLISDLKNKALRPRHWQQIQNEMNRSFDHTASDFTLEKIIGFGFDQYAEFINEVSGAATKELAIEQGLEAIAATWVTAELDITPYKDKGHFKLKSTEEIFQALEDNQVQLGTMKASRFVKAFEKEVDYWERSLSHIMETIETLLVVQRQWMYLENIFLGEDIRKQLPRESAEFDSINKSWKEIMSRLNGDKNALRGTHYAGLLNQLLAMNEKLEEIQKSLDMYLETKRQIFPRFYFLSNDDLLEILGQSKNPEAIQPHLKKCFDNIKSLKMAKAGVQMKWEAAGMFSCEGEYVEFGHAVILEGPVEAWLCDVEKTMRWTLKEILRNCRAALKKNLSKRDKWIKEWPGQ
ncbi:unnamed protein product, partial [Candidula unifasciata]